MIRKKSQKVFKHILCNPFTEIWPEISNEETHQFLSIFRNESLSQALNSVQVDTKRQKVENPSLESLVRQNIIVGINNVIENIGKVSFVIVFACEENQVLIEPLMLLCKTSSVNCVSASFAVAYEKLREITGIPKLAAIGFPVLNIFPMTMSYLNSVYKPPKRILLKTAIKSVEIPSKHKS